MSRTLIKSKWEAFKQRSLLYKVVAVWVVGITTYNLFYWVIAGSLFALLGFTIGIFILLGMWSDLGRQKKEYNRYRG